jgi:hypothetical protein
MNVNIPEYLSSTYNTLIKAFPDGIAERDYYPLLAYLYDYVSDGHLALLVSQITGKPHAVVWNDALASTIFRPLDEEIERVKEMLVSYCYNSYEWM